MKKFAKNIQIGEIFRPWISERTMRRSKLKYTATALPKKCTNPAFSHFVTIPCIDAKGCDYNVFIFSEETVEVIEESSKISKPLNRTNMKKI